jgi:hypothetical protein
MKEIKPFCNTVHGFILLYYVVAPLLSWICMFVVEWPFFLEKKLLLLIFELLLVVIFNISDRQAEVHGTARLCIALQRVIKGTGKIKT